MLHEAIHTAVICPLLRYSKCAKVLNLKPALAPAFFIYLKGEEE
jgi:hypothetical protein